jgi:hypothetical protein
MAVTLNSNLRVSWDKQSPNIDINNKFIPKQGIHGNEDGNAIYEGSSVSSIISTVLPVSSLKQGSTTLKPYKYSPDHGSSNIIKPNIDIEQGGTKLIDWKFKPKQGDIKIILSDPTIEQGSSEIEIPDPKIKQGQSDIVKPNPKINHGYIDIIPPDVDIKQGETDPIIPNPIIDQGTADIKKSNPNIEQGRAKIEIPNPIIKQGEAEIVKPEPIINQGSVDINIPDPKIKQGESNITYIEPTINQGSVDISISNPNINQGSVEISISNPDIEQGTSKINIPNPEINQGESQIQKPDPDIVQGSTKINIPNPIIKQGESNIKEPDPDINQGGTEIIVPNPKINQGSSIIKESNPDIIQGSTDIDIPNPKIEQGNVNITIPNPVINQGSSEIVNPDPDINQGSSNISIPNPKINQGSVNIVEPNPTIEQGQANITLPDPIIDQGRSNITIPNPNIDQGSSNIIVPNPNINQGSSTVNVPNPNINQGSSTINIPNPNINQGSANVIVPNPNINQGSINVTVPNPNINQGSINVVQPNPNINQGSTTPTYADTNPILGSVNVGAKFIPPPQYSNVIDVTSTSIPILGGPSIGALATGIVNQLSPEAAQALSAATYLTSFPLSLYNSSYGKLLIGNQLANLAFSHFMTRADAILDKGSISINSLTKHGLSNVRKNHGDTVGSTTYDQNQYILQKDIWKKDTKIFIDKVGIPGIPTITPNSSKYLKIAPFNGHSEIGTPGDTENNTAVTLHKYTNKDGEKYLSDNNLFKISSEETNKIITPYDTDQELLPKGGILPNHGENNIIPGSNLMYANLRESGSKSTRINGRTHVKASDNDNDSKKVLDEFNWVRNSNADPYKSKDVVDPLMESESALGKDFVKLIFTDLRENQTYQFRSYISSFSDRWSPNYTDINYIGRPSPLKTFNNVTRDISLDFIVPALSRGELPGMYKKLNALSKMTIPDISGNGLMISPFIRFQLGDYIKDVGHITSLTFDIDTEYPWEINIENDDCVAEVPQIIKVSMNIFIVGEQQINYKNYDAFNCVNKFNYC